MDFNNAAKDQPADTKIINFKAEWSFKRDNPIGKERAVG
jgi:hypothetical protein